MAAVLNETRNARRNRLIEEIQSGETVKDVLLNAAFPFEAERQASYFSRARNNMKSDMAHSTMGQSNQADDFKILKEIRNGKLCRYNQGL